MSWSKKYYADLSEFEHDANDGWFKNMLSMLTDKGILYVPNLDKRFNKQGEEEDE
tara:strand:+ start:60 stop:224 length:165 start_codon:yes stop_codon:yes gene_type:complete